MAKCFKAGDTWVAELSDDDWFPVSGDEQADYVQQLKVRARVEGCDSIAIFCIPDAIFPMYGHTQKMRVHSEQLAGSGKRQYDIHTCYRGEIPLDVWQSTPENLQGRLLRQVRDALNERGVEYPGRYEIVTVADRQTVAVLERGRV